MAQPTRSSRIEADSLNAVECGRSINLAFEPLACNYEATQDLAVERRESKNRRDGTWRAFLYGNFRPRRRSSRRQADQHQVLFDWHEPRILYLALGVLLLSCTDALFTLNLLQAGASEANIVMASMLEKGVEMFVIGKISITSLSVVALVTVARRKLFGSFSVEHLLQAFCACYVLVICYELYLFNFVFGLKVFTVF